jgi:DNA-binding Lrp family transcriptional regulator
MTRNLDSLDLTIIDALANYGVRNVSYVAEKLNIPAGTLHKRLKRLSSNFFLKFNINIYHTNLGLKKAVVFADAVPGYEELVFECLKANDFWIYVSRYYGRFEGCLAIYTIPVNYCAEFERFIKEIERLNIVRNMEIFWATCFQTVQSRSSWFEPARRTWNFRWEEWVKEIFDESPKPPYTLVDPKDFPIMCDEIDLFILKELEKDATKDLTEIGKMLGKSQQLMGYHFNKHIIPRGLIESFEVTFLQFSLETADMFFFVFRFDSNEKLAKFANSLLDKPFASGLGKVLGKNNLIALLYFPRREFRRFIESLSKLARSGFLKSYDYVIQDLEKTSRQTISYEYFKNKKWIYEHKKHVENLRRLVRKAQNLEKYAIKKYA